MKYTDKKNVLELVAVMLRHGITDIVLSPGSRNAPLLHTFSQHPEFKCYSVVDERSAAFFGLGLAQQLNKPVAICCTSGSALLNYAPAVAEAFYQQIPLLIISADRPLAWLGQQDGQMLPQHNALKAVCNYSVQLPEINTQEERWFCNRLINQAILNLYNQGGTPSHINIPIAEPLYNFTTEVLPEVRIIRKHEPVCDYDAGEEVKQLQASGKIWVLCGQMNTDASLTDLLQRFAAQYDALVISEHTSNLSGDFVMKQLDAMLYTLTEEEQTDLAPEIVISIGGHWVSRRIKQFLRSHTPKACWSLQSGDELKDAFSCLSEVYDMSPTVFLNSLLRNASGKAEGNYATYWNERANQLQQAGSLWIQSADYSDLKVIDTLMSRLPMNSFLHLGNSSSVRNAQLCNLDASIRVISNRGVSGIDGIVSTTVGFACETSELVFLFVGDLSFFYDQNGLWNKYVKNNLRIVLMNNGSGGIFHLLPGADKSEAMDGFIACHHQTQAKEWVLSRGFEYLSASDSEQLDEILETFMNKESNKPLFLEVFTSAEVNPKVFRSYYHYIKTLNNGN